MARIVIHLIAHTHWDREWYLPLGGFRGRLVPLVDELLMRLSGDPRFPSFFLDGQTVHLEDYLALRPERRGPLRELVRAGRLRTGPWYVLADEQIPTAESLVRNLTLGRRDLAALGGSSGVLYSPDAFGHPAILPLLADGFGLGTIVVWRGLHDSLTDGLDLAEWAAPDGSRVTVYHLPADGYEIGSNLLVPNAKLAGAWERVAEAVMPRASGNHVAVLVGADHHAPDPDLETLPARLAAIDPSVEFRWSTLEGFLDSARGSAGPRRTITGELRDSYGYTWTLQGAHATRAPLKRRHADLELLLTRLVEPLLATSRDRLRDSRLAVLRHAWRELIQCQFHDTLAGTAADSVARAMQNRMTDVAAAGSDLVRLAVHTVAGHDPDDARDGAMARPRLLVWNGVPRSRRGVLIAEGTFFHQDVLVGPTGDRKPRMADGYEPFVLCDSEGGLLAPQLLSLTTALERRDAPRHYPDQDMVERVRFAVPLHSAIRGMAFHAFDVQPGDLPTLEEFTSGDRNGIWNGRLRVAADSGGTMTLESAEGDVTLAGLLALESDRDEGDSYSFAPLRGDRPIKATRLGKPRLTASGPFVSSLQWGQRMAAGWDEVGKPGRVDLGINLELHGDSPAVRCTLRLENGGKNHRLRLRFPLGLKGVPATAGVQFGQITRSAMRPPRKQKLETPAPTAPAHRWVAAAKGDRGLAIFAPGFFEYEWTREGELLVTLLRSIGDLSRNDLATRPGHAGWPTGIPDAQCLGSETISLGFALIRAADLAAPERLEELWEDLFVPPVTLWERDCTGGVDTADGIELSGAGLVFSACYPAESGAGMILRCYNARDTAVDGVWRLTNPVERAARVRLDETVLEDLPVTEGGSLVRFSAGPRSVVTVRVTGDEMTR